MKRSAGAPGAFSSKFLFGVATADHQCEAYDAAYGDDVRDCWERRPDLTPRGDATDFWQRFPEDVELAKRLGCTAFRISISWARVEPRAGQFDPKVIAHYRDVLEAIRGANMASVVTLHHNVWPVHLETDGGMPAASFPDRFAAYARKIAEELGSLIDYYVTINEPNQLVFGYVKPWWSRTYAMPPGLERGADTTLQMTSAAKVIRNLFIANRLAYDAIHEVHERAKLPARVGCNPFILGLPGWLQQILDLLATRAREKSFARDNRFLSEPAFIERGGVDVIVAQFTGTLERADQTNFSAAYLVAQQALLVADGTDEPSKEFHGSIAAVRGTTAIDVAAGRFPRAVCVEAKDTRAAIRLLRRRRVSAVLGDDVILAPYARSGLRLVRDSAWSHDEPYVAAVAPGNRELLNAVDCAIKNFKSPGPGGSPSPWEQSVTAHLPEMAGAAPPNHWSRPNLANLSKRTPERPRAAAGTALPPARKGSLLYIVQRRGKIRVGVRPGVRGLCEVKMGRYRGLEVDLARYIALQIFGDPKRVVFRRVATDRRIASVRAPFPFAYTLQRGLSIFSTVLTTNWWHLGMRGKLPHFLCPPECAGKQDYVGLDYYWGIPSLGLHRVIHLFEASIQRYSRAPVWPSALGSTLERLTRQFPGQQLLVVENGCVDEADGITRSDYLRDHISEVQRAADAGIDVAGYFCWSITSNREWGLAFNRNSNFGLYFIDLDGEKKLERVEKDDSAATYRNIIAQRSV